MLSSVYYRFMEKVEIPAGDPSACHPWTGALNEDGTGRFTYGGHEYLAHRVSWMIEHGIAPDRLGLQILQTCGNRACTNNDHLLARKREGEYFTYGW